MVDRAGPEVPAGHPLLDPANYEWWREWFACERPEALPDDYTIYWSECDRCMTAFAAASVYPGRPSAPDLRTPADPTGLVVASWDGGSRG